jgi:hypothetical protein
MRVTARSNASDEAFVRSVFKTTPYSCGVRVRFLAPWYRGEVPLRA